MTLSNAVMLVAGIMVLLSVALTKYVSYDFIYLTIAVGVMMVQSTFTGFCPAGKILKSLGIKE
jgi:hypothetical protein